MAPIPARRSVRLGFAAVAALVVALSAWLALRGGEEALAPSAPSSARTPVAEGERGSEPIAAAAEPRARAAVESAVPTAAAPAGARPPDPPPARELPDLAARDWLVLRVVDERRQPVFDALATIRGLRKEGDEGSWYGRRGGETSARTDRDGRARVDYERWTDVDGKTVKVDLVVAHPAFIPFNDSSFVLASGEHEIQLRQGAMVWVGAWHGSRERRVADVSIVVEWEAELDEGAWRREPDGRWSTTRLAPGPHWITVMHESAELGRLASDFTPFELGEHARVDLELELEPLVTLRGRLDDVVPRPIVNGRVWINLHASDGGIGLNSDHEAVVAPDGTFEVPGLRATSGQLIAMCDGWVSTLVPPRTWAEAGITAGEGTSEEELQRLFGHELETGRFPQAVDAAAAQTIVVAMERTGELEVKVVDEAGAPLEGVQVSAWPNVFWSGVGSAIFPWREWRATTDARGVARIENLPVDPELWFGAHASSHRMRKADRDEHPSVAIESGATTRYELVLERNP